MGKFVFGELIKALGAADVERGLRVRDVRNRRDQIIRRCKRRTMAVGIDHRPVFEVHVGIADQGVEGEPANEFGNVGLAAFGGDDVGDTARIASFVFVVGIDTEDLGEILDVDGSAVREPVKALDGERLSFQRADPFREVPDGIYVDEAKRRHVHPDHLGERHHRIFILGHALERPGMNMR